MELVQVPPEHFDKLPARCLDDIKSAAALSHGDKDPVCVIEALEAGRSQLWVALNEENQVVGTVVTKVAKTDSGPVCIIECLGADPDQVQAHLPGLSEIERWARYNGCIDLRVLGRRAWRRLLAPHGFEHRYEVIGKRLD